MAHSDEDKADELNSFFASVFTREDTHDIPEPDTKHHGQKLSTITVTEEEETKKLNKLNPSKSPGPDGMHPRVLKEVAEEISFPLTCIFKKSLEEGVLPDDWKVAHVTAIYKKGGVTSPGNYDL